MPIGIVGDVPARGKTANAGALSPGALARDGQFRALAALARTSTPEAEPSVRALAAKAGVADALDWLLVLDLTETQWAAVADALPAKVRLSERHVRIIDRLVRAAVATPTTNAAAAAAKLVAALPAGPDRAKTARKFLAQPTGVLRDTGVRLLASSTDPKDRALLVNDAAHPGLELPDRLNRVDALGALTTTAETKTAKTVLDEIRSYAGALDDGAAGRVASRLKREWVRDWFYDAWPVPPTRALTERFGQALGRDGLSFLVQDTMTPEQVSAVYAAAGGLRDWEENAAVAALLARHGHLLPDAAARYLKDADNTPGVRAEAWQVLLDDKTGALVGPFAAAASPESVTAAAQKDRAHPRAVERLAQVAVQMVPHVSTGDLQSGRYSPDPAWVGMVSDVTGELGQEFLRALAPLMGSTVPAPEILDLVVADTETVHAFIDAGAAADLVGWARTPKDALALLSSSGHLLGASDAEILLDVVGTVDLGKWTGALDAIGATHPAIVRERAARLVGGLSDPVAAKRPKAALVAATVQAALQYGLPEHSGKAELGLVLSLLRHRNDELVAAGARWARAIDPGAVDLDVLVAGAVDAETGRALPHPALNGLRTHLAGVLVADAEDSASPSANRAHALSLAENADPVQARAAALRLGGDDDPDLNLAAATVLAGTDGTPDDTQRLEALRTAETDAHARDLYALALTRVTVKDAAAAIERVLALTDQPSYPGLVIAVAPADGTDEADRLVHAVNDVLAANSPGTPPTHFITAATALADELMYAAITAAADNGVELKGLPVEKIRARADSNPGALTHRQTLLDQFPWVSAVGTLHSLRQAHVTKKGQTRPRSVTEADRVLARQLLGKVVTGWLDSVHDLTAAP